MAEPLPGISFFFSSSLLPIVRSAKLELTTDIEIVERERRLLYLALRTRTANTDSETSYVAETATKSLNKVGNFTTF